MSVLSKIFGRGNVPSAGQLRKALKQVTETHGDAAVRVGAMERLASWGTPEAISALLRRFTIQVPQGSMDLEEKQYTVRLLTQIGTQAVLPIIHYLKTEHEVTWPARALREILPLERYCSALKEVLESLSSGYSRWSEAKAVLIQHLPEEASAQFRDTVVKFLQDEDDDVCIAAIDYLARTGDDPTRELLLETFLNADARPRVRGRILDHFCDQEWAVKGYRKKVEEAISDPFYLTSKGTVKRRAL